MMPREKIAHQSDRIFVPLSNELYAYLHSLRKQAVEILALLESYSINGYCYGSLARGDVTFHSDIDIALLYPIKTFYIEMLIPELEKKFGVVTKKITQATPFYTPKASIEFSHNIEIAWPLVPPSSRDIEFYKFAGMTSKDELQAERFTPGVNKKLLLIEPDFKEQPGYWSSSILGKEHLVAKKLKVSLDIVKERVRVLTKRDQTGRHGIFLHEILLPQESFQEAIHRIALKNPYFRKKIKDIGFY